MKISENLVDAVRDRFPDFKAELDRAIALTEMGQQRYIDFYLDPHSKKVFKQIAKNVRLVAWGKSDKKQKLILYQQAINLFSQALQTLVFFNSIYINLEPLQNLYREMVGLLPSYQPIQLELNLSW